MSNEQKRNYELLESWAEGEGTEYQQSLGLLARHYRMKRVLISPPEPVEVREKLETEHIGLLTNVSGDLNGGSING